MSRIAIPLLALALAAPVAAGTGTVKGTLTGPDGALADAVVLLDGPAPATAGAAPHVTIDQRNQAFVPRVVAVPAGTTVDFPNHDTMMHNVFSASPAKQFDLGMYDRGETRSVLFDAPGVVHVGCNVHPRMEAFVVVHPNPYLAVSDAKGAYTIAGVPAGTYQLRVWHERLAAAGSPLTVHDDQVETRDVRLSAPR